MPLTGLHHVQVACPAGSEDSLRAFYGGVLGMTEVPEPEVLAARGGVWSPGGTAEIHCGVEAEFTPARKAHPGLLTDDLDGLAAACEAAGHPVQWKPHFPGHRRLYVADPAKAPSGGSPRACEG